MSGLQNILTGPVAVSADIQGHRGQLTTADVTMDLTNAGAGDSHSASGQGSRGRRRTVMSTVEFRARQQYP